MRTPGRHTYIPDLQFFVYNMSHRDKMTIAQQFIAGENSNRQISPVGTAEFKDVPNISFIISNIMFLQKRQEFFLPAKMPYVR